MTFCEFYSVIRAFVSLGDNPKSMCWLHSANPNPTLLKIFRSTCPRCEPCEKLFLPSSSSIAVPFLLKMDTRSCRPPITECQPCLALHNNNWKYGNHDSAFDLPWSLMFEWISPSPWSVALNCWLLCVFIATLSQQIPLGCVVVIAPLQNDDNDNNNDNDLVGTVCWGYFSNQHSPPSIVSWWLLIVLCFHCFW